MVLGVGIGIGPGAAIPVGTEEHTLLQLGLVGTDDVACIEWCTVIGTQGDALCGHLCTKACELGLQPVATGHVSLAVGHARAKGHLPRRVVVGTIGIEGRHHDGSLGLLH